MPTQTIPRKKLTAVESMLETVRQQGELNTASRAAVRGTAVPFMRAGGEGAAFPFHAAKSLLFTPSGERMAALGQDIGRVTAARNNFMGAADTARSAVGTAVKSMTGFNPRLARDVISPRDAPVAPPATAPTNRGASVTWEAPAAPTLATQAAPASVAQSGGGVTPPATPFMAAKPAAPIAPATAPVTGAPMTPGPVQAPAPVAAGVVHQGPFPGTLGTNTLTRDIAGSVSTEPGAAFVPVSQLKVGEASVVVPPGAKMQPEPVRGGAFDNQQGFLDSMEAATNALRGVDRTPNFTNKQVELQQAGVDRLKRGFMSPRERADTLTSERRVADRGFMGDKLQSAENIEKTRAQGAVDVAKEAAKGDQARAKAAADAAQKGRYQTIAVKNANGGQDYVTIDTTTGFPAPEPPTPPSEKFLSDRRRTGVLKDWNKYEGSDAKVIAEANKMRTAEAQSMSAGTSPQQQFDDIVRKAQEGGQPLTEEELRELRRRVGL